MEQNEYNVKSLSRAIRVLECFSLETPELGVTEIARKLDMQKSTIHNILCTFQQHGYVSQDPKTSKYTLGFKILRLSYIVNQHMGLRELLLPYLHKIADTTQESCYFGILDQGEVLYIEVAYPSGQTQQRAILGERAPLYCTGLGKAMLAYLPAEQINETLSREMKNYTPYTLCQPDALRANLEEIRLNGYAVDNMEHEFGVRCVAVPLFGANGLPVAAVSVSGPSPRFDHTTIATDAQLIMTTLQPLQHTL